MQTLYGLRSRHHVTASPGQGRRVTRRGFLRVAAGTAALALVSACAQQPAAAPAKPAEAPKPTEVPMPAAAPAKPAEAAKPAEKIQPPPAPAKAAEPAKPTAAPAAKTAEIVRGGQLRVGLPTNPLSLHTQLGTDVLSDKTFYDSLITLDEQLNPQPGLAEAWETPDDKTLILKIRKGVKFHDGTELNAEAVKFNIDDTKDPNTRSAFRSDLEPIDVVEIVDSHTVRLKLKGGGAALLAAFALQAGNMFSPTARQKFGADFGRNPVGAGPYQFVEWVENDHITGKRFPDYWNKDAAYVDEVVFRVVPDPAVMLSNLRAGELDVILRMAFKDVPTLRNNQEIKLYRTWAGADRFIFNNSKPPFDNKPLRQALQLAYDREAIHRTIFFESGVLAYGPVHPPGSWAFDENWKPYPKPDMDAARAKLREGGHPDGFEFSIDVSDAVNRQLGEVYQAMYEPLGVKINIDMMEGSRNLARAFALEYQCRLSTWQTTADPSPALWTPYHTQGSANYLKYSNPRVDELLDKALLTYDKAQRRTFYREVDQILAEDAPCIIPYHRARYDAASAKVQGLTSKSDPQFETHMLWLAK
jgi:peptide/nickel transport system substrate-binding protein